MKLATVYSMSLDDPDRQGSPPPFWYWVECDEKAESVGHPSTPYGSKRQAEASAKAHGFRVIPRQTH